MTAGFWLITSGAYISQELVAEFGQMPPAFLPIGTRRLYEYQLERIGPGQTIYLTIPETFQIPDFDQTRLSDLGVTVLPVPVGTTLGESIVFALNLIGSSNQPVRLLHGDTLVEGMPFEGLDQIGTATGSEGYSWAEVELDGDRIVGLQTVDAGVSSELARPIVCGYFAFRETMELVRSITRARGNFIAGVLDYAHHHDLQALRVPAWNDFGHVQTFFRSRRIVTSARHFNELKIDGRIARKSSRDRSKMRAEADWLANIPPDLRVYSARLIDRGEEGDDRSFYETEYGYLPTLAELFVYGMIGRPAWMRILQSCGDFLNTCVAAQTNLSADDVLRSLVLKKTTDRLRLFADQSGFDVDGMLRYDGHPLPSLMQIADDISTYIDFGSGRNAAVMHGDFCFSNILYDSRVQRIRVIDPRGYVEPETPTIYGDVRYDLAKLCHSVVGRYDQLIAGRYTLNAPSSGRFELTFEQAPHHAWLEQSLETFEIAGIRAGGREVRAVTIALFLSMLPLHSDRPDRQRAFVANALRLYRGLEGLAP